MARKLCNGISSSFEDTLVDIKKTFVIHGPPGCGKTLHAEAFRTLLGAEEVVDDWDGRDPLPSCQALALTQVPPPYPLATTRDIRILSYEIALALLPGQAAT